MLARLRLHFATEMPRILGYRPRCARDGHALRPFRREPTATQALPRRERRLCGPSAHQPPRFSAASTAPKALRACATALFGSFGTRRASICGTATRHGGTRSSWSRTAASTGGTGSTRASRFSRSCTPGLSSASSATATFPYTIPVHTPRVSTSWLCLLVERVSKRHAPNSRYHRSSPTHLRQAAPIASRWYAISL